MLSSSIYPLANPKGVRMECEICQKTAHIMCTQCRVTFYCDVTHQAADWNGIHEKICQLLIPVRMPLPFFSSKEEREHSKEQLVQRQKYLIDLTRTVAQTLLFECKHEEAIPGALQSMRFASAVYGSLSAELVPSQLLLAEASIGLGRLHEAEEYLSQAQWTMMKTTECINAIQYKLYRNLGLLYTAKCEYDKALWYFADDIYHATRVFGVSDIHAAGGYYHMANVFYKQEKMDIADSLYSEVTDIWKNFLAELVETEIQKSLWKAGLSSPESGTTLVDVEDVFVLTERVTNHPLNTTEVVAEQILHQICQEQSEYSCTICEDVLDCGEDGEDYDHDRIYKPLHPLRSCTLKPLPGCVATNQNALPLKKFDDIANLLFPNTDTDASQKAEAVKILHVIFDMRSQELLVKNGKIGNIAHTLAMLYYLFQDFSKAVEYGELALEDSKMFVHNKKEIATIQRLLTMAKKALSYPGGKGPSPYDWANVC